MRPFTCLRYRHYHLLPGSSASSLKARVHRSPLLSFVITFSLFYLLSIVIVRHVSQRDPTSLFFDPDQGYKSIYSTVRQIEADRYIDGGYDANTTVKFNPLERDHGLCIGIASIARDNVRYFRSAVGSLLAGLHPHERQRLYLILFIAHTDPTIHPAFSESWPHDLADQVLLYNTSLSNDDIANLARFETEKEGFREKALFDYTFLLKACTDVGTPYIAMLEDDVIAMDGWFRRTQDALEKLNRHATDFLYLRLFYTEEFFGWNREEWPRYVAWSLFAVSLLVVAILMGNYFTPESKTWFTPKLIILLCGICMPLYISLLFAAGKITALPWLFPRGIIQMPNFGCCSQGLVFSQQSAHQMITWYEERKVGFVDVLTEEYAQLHGLKRWAIVPSVLQHVGARSSKGDDFGDPNAKYDRSVAAKIWNFAFELNDAETLRREHDELRDS